MKRKLLAVLALCLLPSIQTLAGAPVRVAIVPPTFGGPYPEEKRYCEALADYLQAKLRDTPGVEWVERADLDRLLEEVRPVLNSGADVSPMVLGRLLKADVVLSGHLDDGSWKVRDGKEEFTSELELQVIDLTNASVLAREKWVLSDRLAGISFPSGLQTLDPGKIAALVQELQAGTPAGTRALQDLQAMGPDKIAALARKVQAETMEKNAAVGRKLLTAGLAERRAAEGATRLVSIFFADTGTGRNFDHWEERWQATLQEEAVARPGVRLLQFLGIEQARQEQKLALLGLTRADPSAWQNAADGYVWGNYQAVQNAQTVEAGEMEMEVELFLRLDGSTPTRFARRFKAKDFPDFSRALAREVLEAARGKHTRQSAEANAAMARTIFERLCALVNGGFFQATPPLADTLPKFPHGVSIGSSGGAVLDPIKRLPQPEQKLAYCRQMLDLACFFDPTNNRLQMLRWTLPGPPLGGGPDRQLEPMAECLELLERTARAPVLDVGAFVTGVEAAMNKLVFWQGQSSWTVEVSTWQTKGVFPNKVTAQRQELLNILFPLVVEKLPVLAQRLDEAGVPPSQRLFLAQWLSAVMWSDVKPEFRLQYLAAARKLTPPDNDLTQSYLKLMEDLGDRKRVQSVLMQSEPLNVPPPARTNPSVRTARSTAASAPMLPGNNPAKNFEALLADWKLVKTPSIRRIALPLDRLDTSGQSKWPAGFPAEELLSPEHPYRMGLNISARRISGSGDQLVLGLSAGDGIGEANGINAHLLFQASSEAMQILEATTFGAVCGNEARVLYRKGDFAGWADLLTHKSGVFSPETGSPIATPAALGFDGTGRAVVAGSGAKTVALFDWDKQGWQVLPTPPPPAGPAATGQSSLPVPAAALGTEDAIVLPSWNLGFDQAKQKWRALPDDACLPLVGSSTNGRQAYRGPVMGGRLCADGHLWSWNEQGITDFSIAENRVAWHRDALHLQSICQDGPYLWIALTKEDPPSLPPESMLVLLDRKQHAVLGVVSLRLSGFALYADDRQLWLGAARNRERSQPALLCVDKAKLYAALSVAPPPKAPRRQRASPGNTDAALYAAILDDDPEAARQLLDRGASANAVLGGGQTPALMVAAWKGSEAICRLLLQRGAKPEALLPTDRKNWTALATAARQGNRGVMQVLLEAGAKPTEVALMEALSNEDFESSALLIKAGAPLKSLVNVVGERQNKELARRLLDLRLPLPPVEQAQLEVLAKTDDEPMPDLGNDPKKTAEFIQKVGFRGPPDQLARMVERIPAVCLRHPDLRNCFHWMIRNGCLSAVNAFLEAGAPPNEENSDQVKGPLDEAIGQPEVFMLLLQRGAEPRRSDGRKNTLAERVVGSRNAVAVLPALLEYYPALETRFGYGTFGGTLLCAASTGWPRQEFSSRSKEPPVLDTRTAQTLLDRGVSINAVGREGYTALHGAFAVRSAPMACWLAGAGADLRAVDLAGRTVLDAPYCSVGAQSGFVERIKSYAPKSDLEAQGQQRLLAEFVRLGNYPDLFDAVVRKDLASVREMLQKGWPVDPPFAVWHEAEAKLARGPGLVFIAVKNGQREMVQLLLEHGGNVNIGEAGCDFYESNEPPLTQTAQPYYTFQRPRPKEQCLTPLIVAAEAGDQPVVDLLLDHGAYAPTTDRFLRNAIDAAATPELAAHIQQRTRAQFAAEELLIALEFKSDRSTKHRTAPSILTETPEAVRVPDTTGATPLSRAMAMVDLQPTWTEWMTGPLSSNALKNLGLMHKSGIRLDSLDIYGVTPLHRAVLYGQAKEVAELVGVGLDPQLPDRRGITPLNLVECILDSKLRGKVLVALQSAHKPEGTSSNQPDGFQ